MPSLSDVNWLGVLIGVIFSNALGFLWYGPLFGKTWLNMIGKTEDEIEAEPTMYVVTALASAVAMIGLSVIVTAFGAATLVEGIVAGLVAFIALGAPATFVYTTFEGPPTNVWGLFAAYQLVVYGVMGAVFVLI